MQTLICCGGVKSEVSNKRRPGLHGMSMDLLHLLLADTDVIIFIFLPLWIPATPVSNFIDQTRKCKVQIRWCTCRYTRMMIHQPCHPCQGVGLVRTCPARSRGTGKRYFYATSRENGDSRSLCVKCIKLVSKPSGSIFPQFCMHHAQ
jgi:hypothetical protein